MKIKDDLVKDPVCGMMVDKHHNEIEYLQMHFAFCSTQCQERFTANPGLYVGRPGEKAPKQEGREVIKRRHLHFSAPLPNGTDQALEDILRAMMGIKSVSVDGDRLIITYDLLQATAEQIETEIIQFGIRLGEGWPDRLRRAMIHFQEEDIIAGMEVPQSRNPGGSCH